MPNTYIRIKINKNIKNPKPEKKAKKIIVKGLIKLVKIYENNIINDKFESSIIYTPYYCYNVSDSEYYDNYYY